MSGTPRRCRGRGHDTDDDGDKSANLHPDPFEPVVAVEVGPVYFQNTRAAPNRYCSNPGSSLGAASKLFIDAPPVRSLRTDTSIPTLPFAPPSPAPISHPSTRLLPAPHLHG